jgi:hypothetical protein
MHEYLRSRHEPLLKRVAVEKLTDDLRAELSKALDDFKASFVASEQPVVEGEDVGWDAMSTTSETTD